MSLKDDGKRDQEVWSEVEQLCRKATSCRECFTRGIVQPAAIDLAQPRWIGPNYWSSRPRVVILMLNPGAGGKPESEIHAACRESLKSFRDGVTSLRSVLDQQRDEMEHWVRGRFWEFYINGLALEPNNIAFANIAWCSSGSNEYPSAMLAECFTRHTRQLITMLKPDILLASGYRVVRFAKAVCKALPGVTLLKIPHYAHRGSDAWAEQRLAEARVALGLY